jgi:ferric-dicitrate binding protein FerR (iron transport regulator)
MISPIPISDELEVDAKLRAFVEQPVDPLPAAEAAALRERIVGRIERVRESSSAGHAGSDRRLAWAVFAAAACVPVLAWAFWPAKGQPTRMAGTATIADVAGHASVVGDEVATEANGAARATLATGAIVEMGESSRARFASDAAGPSPGDRIELAAGSVQVSVPKLGPGRALRVRTDVATVVVHGTKFAVVASKGETRVSVTEGLVEVDTRSGATFLSAGMALAVPVDASPSKPDGVEPPAAAAGDPVVRPGATSASTLAAENALLADAMRLRRDRRDDRAIERLDDLLARYPSSPLAETARVERLRALQESGGTRRLVREAQAYLADYPQGFARAEASQMLEAARTRTP